MREPARAVAQYLRETLRQGRRTVRVGPFLAGFDALSQSPALNFAIPDDGAHPTSSDVRNLVALFVRQGRRPRLEFLPMLAPAVEERLPEAGFVPEAVHAVMVATRHGFLDAAPPPGIRIRAPEHAADFWALRRVQNEAFGDAEPDAAQILRLHALLNCGGLALLATTEDGVVVGGGDVTPPHTGLAELAGIGVREDYRRRGIGRAITAALARAAFARGLERVCLTPAGPAEERLYGRVGFVSVGLILYMSRPDP